MLGVLIIDRERGTVHYLHLYHIGLPRLVTCEIRTVHASVGLLRASKSIELALPDTDPPSW